MTLLRRLWGKEGRDVLGVGAADEVDRVQEGFGRGEGVGFVEGWFGEEGAVKRLEGTL